MGQRAKEKIKKIFERHRPEPLDPETDAKIDRILKKATGSKRR
jgi:hypothetical protein